MQIKEGPSTSGGVAHLSEGGLETRLAQAEACLVSGQLSAAASHLQQIVQVRLPLVDIKAMPVSNTVFVIQCRLSRAAGRESVNPISACRDGYVSERAVGRGSRCECGLHSAM